MAMLAEVPSRDTSSTREEPWVHVPDPKYDRYGFRRPDAIAIPQAEFEAEYGRRISQQERRWHRHEQTAKGDTARTKELKRLARQGIPPSRRGEIWQQMAGVEGLRRTEAAGYFEGLVQQEAEQQGEPSAAVRQIDLDLARTFPGHRYFETEKGQQTLRTVLVAYSLRNPGVGYVQGMGFMAALLLLFMAAEPAFWCFVAVVERLLPRDYFGEGLLGLLAEHRTFSELVDAKLPRLAKHLHRHGVQSEPFATRWFVGIFANTLPTETTLRVWDVFFFEGAKILHRIGIALLKVAEPSLLACESQQELLLTLQDAQSRCLDCERLISFAFDISFIGSLPRSRVDALRAHHRRQVLREMGKEEEDEGESYRSQQASGHEEDEAGLSSPSGGALPEGGGEADAPGAPAEAPRRPPANGAFSGTAARLLQPWRRADSSKTAASRRPASATGLAGFFAPAAASPAVASAVPAAASPAAAPSDASYTILWSRHEGSDRDSGADELPPLRRAPRSRPAGEEDEDSDSDADDAGTLREQSPDAFELVSRDDVHYSHC